MKETLKRIKADVILSAILCVALGVILMIWPTQVTKVLLLYFSSYFMRDGNRTCYFLYEK